MVDGPKIAVTKLSIGGLKFAGRFGMGLPYIHVYICE